MPSPETSIVIQGNSVRIEERHITAVCTLDGWMATLNRQQPFISTILPIGCRQVITKGDVSIYVVEQPPQVRTIIRHIESTEPSVSPINTRHRLSFPYCVFVIGLRDDTAIMGASLFYRTTPLGVPTKDEDIDGDFLYQAALWNLYPNGNICIGGTVRITATNISDRVNQYIAAFWATSFNDDLIANYRSIANIVPELKTPQTWEQASYDNPIFVLSVPWASGDDLSTAINRWTSL